MRRHEQGETSYLEMSRGMADSGIEKWTLDTSAMTMTFYDRSGDVLLVDQIMTDTARPCLSRSRPILRRPAWTPIVRR